MKKKSLFAMASLACALILTSCGTSNSSSDSSISSNNSTVFAQNDYAGCYARMEAIKENVVSTLNILDSHNYTVMSGNPDDYWVEDEFYYLDFEPFSEPRMTYTALLNEVDDFSDISSYITSLMQDQLGYQSVSVSRKEKDYYYVSYTAYIQNPVTYADSYGTETLTCRYDPAFQRLQTTSEIAYMNENLHSFFQEFAELGSGEYAFQSDTERMYVQTDADGNVISFYYSELKEPDAETLEKLEQEITEASDGLGGAIATTSSTNDTRIYWQYQLEDESIFLNLSECSPEWVMERGNSNLETRITYVDGLLSVSVVNDFTGDTIEFSVKEVVPVAETENEDDLVEDITETEENSASETEK